MLKIIIKKQGIITNQAIHETEELSNAWLSKEIANCSFGKPERWVQESQEDVSNALESREVILREAEAAIIDPETNEVISEARDAVVITEYRLAAEYTVETADVTAQVEQDRVNQEALAYLASTDWMVTRYAETGTAIPADVLTARAAARSSIVK